MSTAMVLRRQQAALQLVQPHALAMPSANGMAQMSMLESLKEAG